MGRPSWAEKLLNKQTDGGLEIKISFLFERFLFFFH